MGFAWQLMLLRWYRILPGQAHVTLRAMEGGRADDPLVQIFRLVVPNRRCTKVMCSIRRIYFKLDSRNILKSLDAIVPACDIPGFLLLEVADTFC